MLLWLAKDLVEDSSTTTRVKKRKAKVSGLRPPVSAAKRSRASRSDISKKEKKVGGDGGDD